MKTRLEARHSGLTRADPLRKLSLRQPATSPIENDEIRDSHALLVFFFKLSISRVRTPSSGGGASVLTQWAYGGRFLAHPLETYQN